LPPELASGVLPAGDAKPFENDAHLPALVLNADYRPLSYLPLSLWSWQEAIKASLAGRVRVVAEYDKVIRAPSMSMRLPAVVSLIRFQQSAVSRAAFTRFNVFLRDSFQCQYCGVRGPVADLTFDHVIPRSRGGKTSWRNVVTACAACNRRKGGKMLHEISNMALQRQPQAPFFWELQEIARKFPPRYLHETWADYLFWDIPLQRDE
jgi:5-methylcytosine-specific restriction endonuclease McrA